MPARVACAVARPSPGSPARSDAGRRGGLPGNARCRGRRMARGDRPLIGSPSKVMRPGAGAEQPADGLQRGGLAGAVGADQADQLALADLERDALQRRRAGRSRRATPSSRAWAAPLRDRRGSPRDRARISAGAPAAIIRPWFSTRMRSEMPITRRMSCSTSNTVMPWSRRCAGSAPQAAVSEGFMPAAGSSSSSSRGPRGQGQRQLEQPLLAIGQRLGQLVGAGAAARRSRSSPGLPAQPRFLPRWRGRRSRASSSPAGRAGAGRSARSPARCSRRTRSSSGSVRTRPRPAMRSGARPVMCWPSKRIAPAVGRMKPVMTLKAVVLPAPFGPIRLVTWPSRHREAGIGQRDHTADAARRGPRPSQRLVMRGATAPAPHGGDDARRQEHDEQDHQRAVENHCASGGARPRSRSGAGRRSARRPRARPACPCRPRPP